MIKTKQDDIQDTRTSILCGDIHFHIVERDYKFEKE